MSLIYNNGKPIGKCDSFEIQKVQGTSDLIKLENFELKKIELNEAQHEYLEWLKKEWNKGQNILSQFIGLMIKKTSYFTASHISDSEFAIVLTEFLKWHEKTVN